MQQLTGTVLLQRKLFYVSLNQEITLCGGKMTALEMHDLVINLFPKILKSIFFCP